MTTDPTVPDELMRYLGLREQQRAADVQATLDAMTEREWRLVREAAAMGYVRGSLSGRNIPADIDIVAEVVDACLSMPDLYPALSALARRDEETR